MNSFPYFGNPQPILVAVLRRHLVGPHGRGVFPFRRRLLPDEDVGDWSDPTGRLSLMDRSLPESWAGRPLADIEQPGRLSLVSVTRETMLDTLYGNVDHHLKRYASLG